MSASRLMGILFIFCCSALAWFVLGVSLAHRTGAYDSRLQREVTMLWGGRHVQVAPQAWIRVIDHRTETIEENNEVGATVTRHVSKEVESWQPIP
ncbi:MAG: hypothetical protein ACE5HV_16240, partial [Acidobacteriota bacterium]